MTSPDPTGNKTSEAVKELVPFMKRLYDLHLIHDGPSHIGGMKSAEAVLQKYQRMEETLKLVERAMRSGDFASTATAVDQALSFDPLA